MKKIIILAVVLAAIIFATPALAGNKIKTKTICQTATVAASGSYTPVTFNLSQVDGCFSVQFQVSGDGAGKMVYALSNDGVSYRIPEGATDIFTDITSSSGGASGGIVFDDFEPEFAKYLQIGIWETAGANPISVTATVAYR